MASIATALTEIISYGEFQCATTPEKKAAWTNFWKKLLAKTERDRYSSLQVNQDAA